MIDYHKSILAGKAQVCDYIGLLAQRHEKDLRGNKYIFDPKGADRLFEFYSLLKHVEGPFAGQKIKLDNFQKYPLWLLMGWKQKDGLRRFRKVYEEEARKQGKSIRVSGLGIYMLTMDGEQGAQVYAAATKEDQAKIVFEYATQLIRTNPTLSKILRIYTKSIVYQKTFSRFKVLGGDSKTQDGFNPSFAMIDEYHAHPDSKVLNVIESGMGARRQPLVYIITTAGFNRESACYNLRGVAIDVLKGIKTDDRLLPIIHSLDEGDDWHDEKLWYKSNPNLLVNEKINGTSWSEISFDFLKGRYKSAINEGGSTEVDFKTKNLNIWTQAETTWIPDAIWQKNNKGGKYSDLEGEVCYGGLDLAKGIDLNAFVLFFPDSGAIVPYFWMPEAKLTSTDEIDYLKYTALDEEPEPGKIKIFEGNMLDTDAMASDILDIISKYDFKSLAFDRFLAYHGIIQKLISENIECHELGQGYVSLSTPTKEFEKMVHGGEFNHFGNGLLRWMLSNVVIAKDPAGNIKINKGKSKGKVDGIAGTINALAEWMTFRNDAMGELIKMAW